MESHLSLPVSPSNCDFLATISRNATIVSMLGHIFYTVRVLYNLKKTLSFPLNDSNFVWLSWWSQL